MSDRIDAVDDPSAEEMAAIAGHLARAETWEQPAPGIEDAVVAVVVAAIDDGTHTARSAPLAVVGSEGDRRHRRAMPAWLAAAAVVAVVVAGLAIATRGDPDPDGVRIALAGTEAAPGASAEVVLAATPAGLKILLDADGLPAAPDDHFYEAWLSDGTIRVSAGSFHLRGGDGPIELWAGVADPSFNRLSVTLEPIDGVTDSSGDVRLTGEFDLGSD